MVFSSTETHFHALLQEFLCLTTHTTTMLCRELPTHHSAEIELSHSYCPFSSSDVGCLVWVVFFVVVVVFEAVLSAENCMDFHVNSHVAFIKAKFLLLLLFCFSHLSGGKGKRMRSWCSLLATPPSFQLSPGNPSGNKAKLPELCFHDWEVAYCTRCDVSEIFCHRKT